jgi:hypothetical protein
MAESTLLAVGARVNRASTRRLPAITSLRRMTTHHSHRLAGLLAAGLATGALAAPAAIARPADNGPAPVAREAATGNAPSVRSIDEGFDWGSAAIGAGGAGAVLVLLTAGGVAYVSRNPTRAAR